MILSTAATIERNHACGVWGRVALDALFRKSARKHPARVALADAPNRASWTSGEARSLTYAQADEEISRLAGLFKALGLPPDSVLGLQLPNTVDAVVIFLAALRAGLIVAPIPLTWRSRDISDALSMVGAKAVITTDRVEGDAAAEWMRDAAVEVFGLRYVLGLGHDLPDGLVSLCDVLAEIGGEIPPSDIARGDKAADHLATLTWTTGTNNKPMPLPRTHNHWIASGLATMLECRIGDGARILLPYALSGLAGLGCGIVPWLLAGGTLHLHHPEHTGSIAAHADAVHADIVLVPGPLATEVSRRLAGDTALVIVWQAGVSRAGGTFRARAAVDVTLVQELAAIARRRDDDGNPRPLPLGAVHENGVAGAELELAAADPAATRGSGAVPLLVRGPMVPECRWPGVAAEVWPDAARGFLRTRLVGTGDGSTIDHLELNPFLKDCGFVGGLGLDLAELDVLYRGFDGAADAAAFLGPDTILGTRLYAAIVHKPGTSFDRAAFDAYLVHAKAGLHTRPSQIVTSQAIPRSDNGVVDRARLEILCHDLERAV